MHPLLYLPFLSLGLTLNICASQAVSFYAINILDDPFTPLPDIIHRTLPKLNKSIPNYFLFLSFCYILYKNEYTQIENNLFTLGICIILRPFCLFLNLKPTCIKKEDSLQITYHQSFLYSTHDLMFSGHSLYFIFLGYISQTPIIYFFGPFLNVISHQNYSIDVIVSGLVYYFIYTKIN